MGEVWYEIEGDYGQGWELVTAVSTRAEARSTLVTYRREEPGTRFRMRVVNEVAS